MSMIKKLIALTLALAMVLSVSAFAGYKADTYVDAAAIDADCEAAVELMYALEIMKGDDKGQFRPEAGITRAEMAKMIYVILNYGKDDKAVNYTGANFFTDVEAGYWAEGYINYCASTKLIAGRGDGTFDPTADVTTAEAAKMLLTAIGYNAEHRGYTGATWSANVLSDAATLGLLKGYKTNVNGVAPRQWIAVMVANALKCKTFDNMQPTFDGLLSSGTATSFPTMGTKYFGYTEVTGVMTSANGYYIDNVYDADGDVIAMTTTDGQVIVGGVKFKASATIADLGQEFKAIVKGGKAISLRNTGKSVVAEDEVKDITTAVIYGTAYNQKDNYRTFTVDGETAIVTSVNVLKAVEANTAGAFVPMTDDQLKAEIGAVRNDIVRAIDADDDGVFDYVIYTPVEYGKVTKVATSANYGEYIRAVAKDNTTELAFNNGKNLYIKDCFTTAEEFAVGDYFKFSYNMDEEKYDVEILPVIEFVKFENRKISANEYTFAGEVYGIAANCFTTIANLNAGGMLKDDFDLVIDGDLLVYAIKSDDNYKSMDEVNAKLAVLIKADVRNTNDDNDKQVKLLTIDGEQAWYAYDVAGAKTNDSATILTWGELTSDLTADVETDADWNQLVIVHTNKYGEVYLETIPADTDWVAPFVDLNLPTTLVDNVVGKAAELKVKDGVAKFDGVKLAAENKFFAKIKDEYCVVTADELAAGTYSSITAKVLVDNGTYYHTVVGGYLQIGSAAATTSSGWLFILDDYNKEYTDGDKIVYALFDDADATEAEIKITNELTDVVKYGCYYYTVTSGKYTLYSNWSNWQNPTADEDGTLWYGFNTSADLSKFDLFAVKVVMWERNPADGEWEIDDYYVEFVDAERATELVAAAANADETNNYYFTTGEYDTTGDDLLFIKIDAEMNANQDAEEAQ